MPASAPQNTPTAPLAVESSPPLSVLIADDEPLARQRLRRLLAEEPDIDIVGECANGEQALRAIAQTQPDLVFLDIRMPKLDGLAVLGSLPPGVAPAIVFVTGFHEHATAAFEVNALDYVMKPVEPERLRASIARARRQRDIASLASRHETLVQYLAAELADRGRPLGGTAVAERRHAVKRILVREHERRFFVNVADIDWLEAYGNYIRLHVGQRVHLIRGTMVKLAATLDPDQFVRIHRKSIVNLSRVKEIQPWFSGDYVAILSDGTRLRMGRAYRPQFEQRSMV